MASGDATPLPKKNIAYRVTFPILDADGDLVTGATGLDSEVSKDGGTFTDCTNEATEIATSSGMYFLDLITAEMNADTVALIIKTTSSGAKTTPIVLYPEEAGDVRVNVTQVGGKDAAAIPELAQAQPSATPNLLDAIMLLYMKLRNKNAAGQSGSGDDEIHNSAGTVIAKGAITDDGTKTTRAKFVTGP